ncbi:MAG TPA: ABC transporter ATP-binding protein [Candidatus Latescibacteria bacterium]|jgi:peptide/nickel transport system ATP-binding protein|nr:ABC transporter ATP-binding protein [Candidatus Latescibacterota bacterium]|tara:strand:- start:337 stop:2358 length:2022 start_codon:yes stop_codon:yes gene_type:complete
MREPLVQVRNLGIGLTNRAGVTLPILRNIDLAIGRGETIGLVGESGCGKSTLALAMMGYLKSGLHVLEGDSLFRGRNVFDMGTRALEDIRGGELALIPQNAGQSLTPTSRIGRQIDESVKLHTRLVREQRRERVIELLLQVRLPQPEELLKRYPHELSGGQQQRAAIAMALAGEPDVLLLDEPTTGLDVTTQAHILELLRDLAAETGTAMVYVSHDLGAIARVSDRIAVMYAGEFVLEGPARQVLKQPAHPYARGLLLSIPRLKEAVVPASMPGRPPLPGGAGQGCGFADRCPMAEQRCRDKRPTLEPTTTQEFVRCHFHERVEQLPPPEPPKRPDRSGRDETDSILQFNDVAISYAKPGIVDQILGRQPNVTPTINEIDLTIRQGETFGLVGESGSGKSTILRAIAGLLPPQSGTITYEEAESLNTSVEERSNDLLRCVQLIFQNPDASLNPRHTVAEILAQPLKLYFGLGGDELRERSVALLEQVRLRVDYLERLPSQLSGGEKQRVAVARAFAAEPKLVLCDEVTSALDVSVQAAVLDLLIQLQVDQGTTYVFVSHDLAVVRALADRVAVLYQGRLCEMGPSENVYRFPSHPYTEVLLGAVLEPDPDAEPTLAADDVADLFPPPKGCPFQRRCPRKIGDICDDETPPWRPAEFGHAIRCHIPLDELCGVQ